MFFSIGSRSGHRVGHFMTDLFINKNVFYHLGVLGRSGAATATRFRRTIKTTRCIITGVFISLKMHNENVSEKEPIFADAGVTKRALDA
jgi:hypothetical protein